MMRRTGAAIVALSMVAAACGGGDDAGGSADAGDTGVAVVEPVDESRTEATRETGDDTGADDDVATADDDAAASDDEGETGDTEAAVTAPDDRSAYSLDPVEGDDDGASLNQLVLDLHGPTDDLAAEVNRLTTFPAIPTPDDGAVLVDVMTLQDPSDDVDPTGLSEIYSFTRVGFYSSATPEELTALYEGAYQGWGFTTAKTTEESTDDKVSTILSMELGDEPFRPMAEIIISDEAVTELTLVTIRHTELTGGGDRFQELAAWTAPYAPTGAPLRSVQVGTSYSRFDDFASNQIQMEADWELADQTQEQTTVVVQELATASGREVELTDSGATVIAGPYDRISLSGFNGAMGVDILDSSTELVGIVDSIG